MSPAAAVSRRARFYRPPRAGDVGRWKIATAFLRRLPDFLIIGTQRGGTTSLYEYLCRHPQVAAAAEKEIHYFDFQLSRGPAWYRAHFPWRWPLRRRITGEASPFYLFHPRAPQAVQALAPHARLIVMLRNPVDRAHSHYRLQRRAKIEPLQTFEEAIAAEPERLAGQREKMAAQEEYYSYEFHQYSYLARGRYREQIAAWREYFPAEQTLIFPSETFYAQPEMIFDQVCQFLGLPLSPAARAHPPRLNHAPGEEMAPATRRQLEGYFAAPNAALARLLGQELPWTPRDHL